MTISLPEAVGRAAERAPETPYRADSPWVGAAEDVTTYGGLKAYVDDTADRLWAAGMRRGDRLAVIKSDHVDIQAIAAAAMQIGAVPALLSPKMQVEEQLDCLRRLDRPNLLVDGFSADRFAGVRERVEELTAAVVTLDEAAGDWASPLTAREPHTAGEQPEDELSMICHSSGTTGAPKLVGHSNAAGFAHAAPVIQMGQAQADGGFSAKCLSWAHTRTTTGLIAVLELGLPLLAITDPSPAHVKDALLEYRPTGLESQPNLFLRWEPLATDPDRPFGSIRRYISTFDAIHPRTVRALLHGSDQPDVGYYQGYGQSETGPITISVRTRDYFEQLSPRNVGIPIPEFTEARVVDESGDPVPPGTPGPIEARTRGLMLGYVGSETPPLNDGWWNMQDVGCMNEDGTLELLDRVVDHADTLPSVIAIEDALLEALPELAEVVLVKPEPHELAAVVCLQEGESFDAERWAPLAEEHGIADVPVHEWDWDDIPFTGSWKVRRHLLGRAVRGRMTERAAT